VKILIQISIILLHPPTWAFAFSSGIRSQISSTAFIIVKKTTFVKTYIFNEKKLVICRNVGYKSFSGEET
jgi:hypothetical protein